MNNEVLEKHKNEYRKQFNEIIKNLTAKKSERIFNVEKAFALAEKLHSGQFRQTGEPYISHPVAVAAYLEALDFDTDVICAALLHDVVEDSDYSLDQIKQNFNETIAEIVDGVTATTKEDYTLEKDLLFDNEEFLKLSLEGKTYQKLLNIGKKNRFAFYIKFADRLHNLNTISTMAEYKKKEKIKETEKWILPICEIMRSSYFYYEIKNQCFKILNEKKMKSFEPYYETLNTLSRNTALLNEQLFESITNFLIRKKTKTALHKIIIAPRLEMQAFGDITERLHIKSLNQIKSTHFLQVPLQTIYIVTKTQQSAEQNTNTLFALLEDSQFKSWLKLVDISIDQKFNKPFFIVSDKSKNLYTITLLSYNDYINYLNGSTEGTHVELLDDEVLTKINTHYIRVTTPTNDIIKIPADSTLLDFAFKIHNDIGFSFKYGLVNNSPNKLPHYTRLNDGDRVTIVCQTHPETKQNQYIAQIRWLAYVQTDQAKKALIRYFEKKYEN